MLDYQKPMVMGVINLSPHSFYQALPNHDEALKKAEQMVLDGVDIIDVGAIATNPSINRQTDLLSEAAELDTVVSFVESLSKKIEVKISVDTSRATVMAESVKAGANMINDKWELLEENALETAVKLQVPVCLMHHFNPIRIPDSATQEALLSQIKNDLQQYAKRCLQAGIAKENIILDPGFGGGNFGKSADENFYILSHLSAIVDLSFPVLVGLSRKSMLGGQVEDRLPASLAAATMAIRQGASIVRVHDVKETVKAMRVMQKTVVLENRERS